MATETAPVDRASLQEVDTALTNVALVVMAASVNALLRSRDGSIGVPYTKIALPPDQVNGGQ